MKQKTERKKVLGVGIDDVTMKEGLEIVEGWLSRHPGARRAMSKLAASPLGSFLVFTPGPEFLVTAQKDPEFKKILNSADLNIPDGYGLKIFGGITHVVPGVEFMLTLCEMAAKKFLTVGLLGGSTGVAKKTKEKLEIIFPNINIIFAIDGPDADRLIEDYDTLRYVDILFVGLGHPKQEEYLWKTRNSKLETRNKSQKSKIQNNFEFRNSDFGFRVGMGVGGSFDLISGKLSRAPKILQKLGLEWFWRLIQEPERFKRIFRATVIFPFMIFRKAFSAN